MSSRISAAALTYAFLCQAGFAEPAAQDPDFNQAERDARYIVEQTITQELFDVALDSMGDMMVSVLDSGFRKSGIVASDEALETIGTMITDEMAVMMVHDMRDGSTKLYLEQYSPETLQGYRRFLESPAGQEISKGLPVFTGESAKLGGAVGQSIAQDAVAAIKLAGQEGRWPAGTLPSTQREVLELLER
ncbi:MAG: DUF2059 domain-containing protein [Hyphomonas sp.]|uniref:DUF2059 domain-containing protein n=1 Tax=Hyphomonas sp. TaxID=87 RepID=UPI00182D5155|nr:DUF2059 domain-containing protein [Hyphomonas sp.]MBA3069917.1 DUF2059 domain-containing protein [Hyphomonas sp.]MBU4063206.1 DUF2059 domain-containing protein [Alphaproteobacteria bacterium]MBU4164523.1 DUF2059 domain-containing protein [Alphaproteobacteria bacterium]